MHSDVTISMRYYSSDYRNEWSFRKYEVYQLADIENSERQRAVDNQSIIGLGYGSPHSGTVIVARVIVGIAMSISCSTWSTVGLQ